MAAKRTYLKGPAPSPKAFQRKARSVAGATAKHAGSALQKKRIGAARSKKPEPNAPIFKIVVDVNGRRYALQTLDARSETFGRGFGTAFKKSVKKARRENSRVIGRPDFAVAK